MSAAPSFDIERPSGVCGLTGRVFEPDEVYVATLVEVDEPIADQPGAIKTLLRRLDISLNAWQKGQRPPRLFCHWQAHQPTPEAKKRLLVDDDVLMNLHQRLEGTDDEQRLAFRFVLTLILMRKKLMHYESSMRDESGKEWWTVAPKSRYKREPEEDAPRFTVLNPRLDDAGIEQVTQQLGEILQGEL